MGETDVRAQTVRLLRAIAMADKTVYEHHEPRKRDGKEPEGGSIWLTPREMALRALQSLGEETTSLYWPFTLDGKIPGKTEVSRG